MRLWVRSLALLGGLRISIAVSCGIGCRHGSDPAFLWLWSRLAATAPIRPLAWEPPYAVGAAQEMAKRQKKKKSKTPSVDKNIEQPELLNIAEDNIKCKATSENSLVVF